MAVASDQGDSVRREGPARVGPVNEAIGSALWRALRPHQWAKNLLVFVPLALTPALHGDRAKWLVLLAAFASWSAVASAGANEADGPLSSL